MGELEKLKKRVEGIKKQYEKAKQLKAELSKKVKR